MKHLVSKQNRALISELVRTDFKLRYQGSALGYLWSLLRPLFMFLILYIVFTTVIKVGDNVPHFPVYLLLGIVLWNFFVEMTNMGLNSIVGRAELIRKIKIPRWIIVFSASLSALINLAINLLVVVVFMVINKVDLMGTVVLLPLSILEIYIFALGISLFLAATYVKFRDINYVWEVLIQAGFYLTPILYPLTLFENPTFQKMILLNPMAQAVQSARYGVVSHDPQVVTFTSAWGNPWFLVIPLGVVAVALVVGVWHFRRESKYFAENI